jgi:membrane protease YdiL (CAAX protease family)
MWAPPRAQGTVPGRVAALALAVTVVGLLLSRVVASLLIDTGVDPVAVIAAVGLFGYGLPLVAFVSVRSSLGAPGRDALGLRARWADLGWGPVTWLCCLVVQAVVGMLVLRSGVPFEGNAPDLGADGGLPASYVVALLLLTVVAAPVVEEIVFRGMVLRALMSTMPVGAAVAVQGVLFGLAHVDPSRGIGNIGLVILLSSVGCVLGGAAVLTRRLAAPMIAHAIVNALAMAIALLA